MQVPLLDLKPQYEGIRDEIAAAVQSVLDSQRFILGPAVESLEKKIAAYCGCPHAVGVSSGTDALLIALMAAGIAPGDRVVTTPYSFFATAGSIVRLGAVPVFADIDPCTYNLSPDAAAEAVAALDPAQRERVRAIVPVHLYGQCADMQPLLKLAAELNAVVVEDAAQAIGAEDGGRRAGSMGDFGCFSFFPSKNLGAFGDGGMVTVSSGDNDERLRILRAHGARPKYYHKVVGGNFRLDALQAAVVDVKLGRLDDWTAGRQRNARRYRELFAAAGLAADRLELPVEAQGRHIYNQFVIRVPGRRDELRAALGAAGIGSEVYYPVPLHLQECFADLGYRPGAFPVSEAAALSTLALPIYPELRAEQQEYVVEKVGEFLRG